MIYVAIDTETRLIDYPHEVNPMGVCWTASIKRDKNDVGTRDIWPLQRGAPENGLGWLQTWLRNPKCIIIGHNIAFDLHVILKTCPALWEDVWTALQQGRISDTFIREKLYLLGTLGDTHAKGCSLAALVERYLDEDISESKKGDTWRFRYQELENVDMSEWPQEALDYAVGDAVHTLDVWMAQEEQRTRSGPGSMNSEALQVASAFALRGMTIQGIRIDQNKVKELEEYWEVRYNKSKERLKDLGIVRENGTRDQKALQEAFVAAGSTSMTASGRPSTDRKTLMAIENKSEVLEAYEEYSNSIKPVTTFIPQMKFERIHPEYNPIVNTLRTSCRSSNYYKYQGQEYGKNVIKRGDPVPSINLQQIPRDSDFRQAFIPEKGHVFICADYANLELVCTGQTHFSLFGRSSLRTVLNSGKNLHDYTGTIIYNDYKSREISVREFKSLIKSGDSDAKFCRQSAKFVNLGCPGGQSARTIHKLANQLGIPITLEQAQKWRIAARTQYPEFDLFFNNWFPTLNSGKMYLTVDNEGKMVERYDGEVHGVWRAKATYTAMANCIHMQMPAALGKKRAMVRIYERMTNPRWRDKSALYGCKIHIDMHDEFLISAPIACAERAQQEMADCMLDGMLQICKDMRVEVESMILTRWNKSPEDSYGSKAYWKFLGGALNVENI